MSKLRDLPVALDGATNFSLEPELLDQRWAVRLLKRNRQWLNDLLRGTDLTRPGGRPREDGDWGLAYLAYVVSRHPNVQPWWATASTEVWRECGFRQRPSYKITWQRFAELEGAADAFRLTANKLIRHAVKASGGKVGMDIHVDGTEAETHARLVHDCEPGESCARASNKRANPVFLQRLPTLDAREARHQEHAQAPDEHPGAHALDLKRKVKRVRINGCWYRSRDTTAGVRHYQTRSGRSKKFWLGFYNHKAIDHYTGAPLVVLVESSSVNEHLSYPGLLDLTIEATGGTPRAVVADKGLSVASVFDLNTKHGIASVMPYRKPNGNSVDRADTDTDAYDRHGIPRCKHCGGPGRFLKFAANPHPRVHFTCSLPITTGCEKEQTISCSRNPRYLLPLWRDEDAYFALKETHSAYERAHILWRTNYAVGADNISSRPKRIGIMCQQLRANAALVIEWLRILDREGWLGSARRNKGTEFTQKPKGARRFRLYRSKIGLNRPYGKAADALRAASKLPTGPEFDPDPPGDADPAPF